MSCDIREESIAGGIDALLPGGYLDFDAAPRLKEHIVRLLDTGRRRLIVDLSTAGFIDSTGIGVLVGGFKRACEAGGSLVVVCADEQMRELFEIVGLADVIPLYGSRDHAVSALVQAA